MGALADYLIDEKELAILPVQRNSQPDQARAEVERNFQALNTQIAEADRRLATTVGQGGPNFIRNAILGPLADKRFATVKRIETAIGRHAAKPDLNAVEVAVCTLKG